MRLLFVDDDSNLINIFKKWSSIKGYNAEFAYNGSEVLELVKKEHFDIILMDIDMPIIDGITTAEKLK
ncbi:MAG: response regulator, partial [Candidatus Hydrogenedens sp.]